MLMCVRAVAEEFSSTDMKYLNSMNHTSQQVKVFWILKEMKALMLTIQRSGCVQNVSRRRRKIPKGPKNSSHISFSMPKLLHPWETGLGSSLKPTN